MNFGQIIKKQTGIHCSIAKRMESISWISGEINLLDAGVKAEHMAVTNVCTCCNHELLFSHRYTKGKRGNLSAFLALKEETKVE